MNAAVGMAGVVLGAVSSLLGFVTLVVALRQKRHHRLIVGRSYAYLAFLGAVIAFAAMERALITRDFTVRFVAEHGSRRTPALFNVATLWSALEGSLLLWILVLTGYGTAIVEVLHGGAFVIAWTLIWWRNHGTVMRRVGLWRPA